MAGFLRRLRRAKEAGGDEAEEATPVPDAAVPEAPTPPTAPEPEAPTEIDAPVPKEETPAPSPPEATTPAPRPSPPPPLPEADRDAARSSLAPRRNATKCFLCGTEMDGPWCPTCRMAWTD